MDIDDPPTFSATTPHFFKIIPGNSLRYSKLRIPKKFVKKYGEDLSNPVYLKLPSGCKWQVELKKCDGAVWFEKGWTDFSEFYSLDCGHLLVFGYEGNSKFYVCIFDASTTEIEYPMITSVRCDGRADIDGEQTVLPEIEATEDDVSVEILEDFSPCCPKTRHKSPLPCPRPQKKNRTSSSSIAERTVNLQNGVPKIEVEIKREDDLPNKKDGGGSYTTHRFLKGIPKVLERMHPLTTSEKAIALQRANAFKSENPFVKVVMQPSYIHGGYLIVPSEFARRHLNNQPGNIILQVLDGRSTWSVNFTCKHPMHRFRNGWLAFVRDNNLKVGDVCVFTLMNKINPLLEVVFFRTTEVANLPLSPGKSVDLCICAPLGKPKTSKIGGQVTQSQRPSVLEPANNFVSKNPFFRVSLRSISNLLLVPNSFAKSFIKQRKQKVTLQVADRFWPVTLIGYSVQSSAKFSTGWQAFAKENCLRGGDVCIFELIKRNDIVMEVHIFQG